MFTLPADTAAMERVFYVAMMNVLTRGESDWAEKRSKGHVSL